MSEPESSRERARWERIQALAGEALERGDPIDVAWKPFDPRAIDAGAQVLVLVLAFWGAACVLFHQLPSIAVVCFVLAVVIGIGWVATAARFRARDGIVTTQFHRLLAGPIVPEDGASRLSGTRTVLLADDRVIPADLARLELRRLGFRKPMYALYVITPHEVVVLGNYAQRELGELRRLAAFFHAGLDLDGDPVQDPVPLRHFVAPLRDRMILTFALAVAVVAAGSTAVLFAPAEIARAVAIGLGVLLAALPAVLVRLVRPWARADAWRWAREEFRIAPP